MIETLCASRSKMIEALVEIDKKHEVVSLLDADGEDTDDVEMNTAYGEDTADEDAAVGGVVQLGEKSFTTFTFPRA